jgi:hypothetical protein
MRRDVNFTGKTNPGPRQFYQSQDQHFGFARFTYAPLSKLQLFASYENLYTRLIGNSLPSPDSKIGQANATASNDPTQYRADSGSVQPAAIYMFGGDYTITSNLLFSARYGYLFSNAEDRGKPTGVRHYIESGSRRERTPTSHRTLSSSSTP